MFYSHMGIVNGPRKVKGLSPLQGQECQRVLKKSKENAPNQWSLLKNASH